MDKNVWNAYRAATGAKKIRLRDKLIADNEALAKYYVAEFAKRSSYYTNNLREDLLQAARIGMLRGLDVWDPEKGGFSAVAFWWAIHEMQLVVRHASGISVPKSAFMPKKKQDEIAKFVAINGRDPTPEEVGLTKAVFERAHKACVEMAPMSDAKDVAAENLPDMVGDIDRASEIAALKKFVSTLCKKDQKEFWGGSRPDLVARARSYVEKRQHEHRKSK